MKEVAIRSMHIDLKGLAPKAEYAWKLMDDLQSFGYNHILMEFEDKFPFECCPEIVHQGAYTKAELAGFERRNLSVIPLLQCAGHLDYLLSHEKYAFLRDKERTYQWDLSNEQAFDLWRQMAEEILGVYPDAKYFHIGADEVELADVGRQQGLGAVVGLGDDGVDLLVDHRGHSLGVVGVGLLECRLLPFLR